MILRKPYALFIKYFKLIHIILTALIVYLIYRTGFLLSFFNEYIESNKFVTNQDFTDALFNTYMFFIPFLIIIATIVILSVLVFKKKPYLFYVLNIIAYIIVLIIFNYTYGTLTKMETMMLDIRTLRLARDFLLMAAFVEVLTVIKMFISATGFDIKKFNFGEDLNQLEIKEDDREEFEFAIDVDTNKVHRDVRRRFRFARYVYVENKFLINNLVLITIATICFIVYFNANIYNKVFQQKQAFLASNFNIMIENTYITNTDYKKNKIHNDKSLVVIEINVGNIFNTPVSLEIAKMKLDIDGHGFYHKHLYRDRLFDIGISYDNQEINKQFSKYILVYEVPNNLLNGEMSFKYIDKIAYIKGEIGPSVITVGLIPENLDIVDVKNSANLKEELVISPLFGDSKLIINEIKVQEEFKLEYNFCPIANNCYLSYEYLKSGYNANEDRVLLNINGIIEWDEESKHTKINNIFKLFENFGTLNYTVNGVTKNYKSFREAVSTRVKDNLNYYIEVPKEVINAENIKIVLNIRNNVNEYLLK